MNRKEYERAIRDTRRAIYRGDLAGGVFGVVRALVAHNDPSVPPPRELTSPPRLQLKAKPKQKRRKR